MSKCFMGPSASAEATFMPIRVQCQGCKTALSVKDHLAGKRVKCPKCQTVLAVPTPGASPAPMAVKRPTTVKKPSVPVAKPADMEALAAAALRDEPPANPAAPETNGHSADAPIQFHCTYCDFEIETPVDNAGKMTPCPECSRIVRVPLPKVQKPKDWRTVENKGPSLAAVNVPQKIENAWGTETKTRVSQTALLEAGVIEKPKAPPIGLAGWIERGVKTFLVVVVAGGLGLGLHSLYTTRARVRELDAEKKSWDPKWPAPIRAEYFVMLGRRALRGEQAADTARNLFREAWDHVPPTSDASDRIDRDFTLIEIARAQVSLGGDEMQIRGKERYDWNQEVFVELDRTLKKIDSSEARVLAARELAVELASREKPELVASLWNSVAPLAPPAKAVQLALQIENGGKPPPAKDAVRDLIVRCGLAEGLARQGKTDEAIKVAKTTGDTSHKFQALVAIATALAYDRSADRSADIRLACDEATILLEKDARANIPAWSLLQHVRMTARHDGDQAKSLVSKLPTPFRRRAQLEIAVAALDKSPADGAKIIQSLDNEGPVRGLAWLAFARAKARANLHFAFAPEDHDDAIYAPLFRMLDHSPPPAAK